MGMDKGLLEVDGAPLIVRTSQLIDALAGAAEWIMAVENLAQRSSGLVATVGFIEAKPGATNVIAGKARATLDLRHASDAARLQALEELTQLAESTAAKRNLSLTWKTLLAQRSVPMNPFLADQVEQAIRSAEATNSREIPDVTLPVPTLATA